MNTLELKHIAPYLPYDLKILHWNGTAEKYIKTLEVLKLSQKYILGSNNHKPILRPLSDLFKPIDWNNDGELTILGYKFGVEKITDEGEVLYTDEYYADYAESPKVNIDITAINWWLFEYHFDVFGLIEKGLAIDINKL